MKDAIKMLQRLAVLAEQERAPLRKRAETLRGAQGIITDARATGWTSGGRAPVEDCIDRLAGLRAVALLDAEMTGNAKAEGRDC